MVGYGVVFVSVPVGRLLGKDREKNCPAWQHNVVNRRAGNRSCSVNESEVDFFYFTITQQLAAMLTLCGRDDEQYICLVRIIRSLIGYKYFIPPKQKYCLFW